MARISLLTLFSSATHTVSRTAGHDHPLRSYCCPYSCMTIHLGVMPSPSHVPIPPYPKHNTHHFSALSGETFNPLGLASQSCIWRIPRSLPFYRPLHCSHQVDWSLKPTPAPRYPYIPS